MVDGIGALAPDVNNGLLYEATLVRGIVRAGQVRLFPASVNSNNKK